MICNYQKTQQQQTKQRQLTTCLLNRIQRNLSNLPNNLASLKQSSLLSTTTSTTMSTLAADLRTAAMAAAAGNKKSSNPAPMEAVVVNSIIYSKPSFCRIAVDVGNSTLDNKPPTTTSKMANKNCPNNIFNTQTFCSSNSTESGLQNVALNSIEAASCLADLAAISSLARDGEDAKVYRMCTTINGSIHHQISDLCDNLLAMANYFTVTNNEDEDDSFIEFAYGDDDIDKDNDEDDDDDEEEDDDDDEDEDFTDDDDDEELDDDNDVVDFSFNCPIIPAPEFNCDKKKKVRFNTKPTVHVMHTWNYAYRAARKGEWEMYARDRDRFKMRIQRVASAINPILEKEHRQKIYEQRFANLYDNDENGNHDDECNGQHQMETEMAKTPISAVTNEMMESKTETSTNENIESKKPHQKKKRRKKRYCKMGNKHYF